MSAIASQLSREHARENAGRGIRVSSLHHDLTASAAPPLGILYAAVCLVLLIACANVAGLLVGGSLPAIARSAFGSRSAHAVPGLHVNS